MRKTIDLIPLGEKWRELKTTLAHGEGLVQPNDMCQAFDNYVTLSEQTLSLWQFVPFDEAEGEVYADHETVIKTFTTGLQKLQYKAALDRVVFEGWKYMGLFSDNDCYVAHPDTGLSVVFNSDGGKLLRKPNSPIESEYINQVSDLMGLGLKVFEG